jgi:hypothetical protein
MARVTKAQIHAAELAVIKSAKALTLAVFNDEVARGVTGLSNFAGDCRIKLNALRVLQGLKPNI